jgi:hypothetical protein
MEAKSSGKGTPEYRRLAIDLELQAGIGRFFAGKFRSGVLYRIHEQSGDRGALEEALKAYRGARAIWAKLAERAKGVYMADITVGERAVLRGHWLDRLPAIDEDIADMAVKLEASEGGEPSERLRKAVEEALGRSRRPAVTCHHTSPAIFRPGAPLTIEMSVAADSVVKPTSVALLYRHVNQAERYGVAEMKSREGAYRAVIPAAYTQSPFPLQYYFELKGAGQVWLHPGFAPALDNQPYFVVSADGGDRVRVQPQKLEVTP